VNFIHVKPGLTIRPTPKLSLMSAVGFQWRETTADAVYVQPNIPVRGTAGKPGRWTGMYVQLRAEWAITPNLAGRSRPSPSRSAGLSGAREVMTRTILASS